MGVGRRRSEEQCEFWVAAEDLGRGPRNVFYDKLNEVLAESDFDRELEKAVEPYYCTTGRKELAPGVYFRMLFIGYFEDISSQRGIAWRCEDSRSLARFLGYRPGESTPDHSTLSGCRWKFTASRLSWCWLRCKNTSCSRGRRSPSMRRTWKPTLR